MPMGGNGDRWPLISRRSLGRGAWFSTNQMRIRGGGRSSRAAGGVTRKTA
jgi:hypothetical protein